MSRFAQLVANAMASDLARGDRFAPYHASFDDAGRYLTPRFPCEVPPRKVEGLRDAPEGQEEGALCCRPLRDGGHCLARLELLRDDDLGGCACFICAPCSSCMSMVPECPNCGHREPEPD